MENCELGKVKDSEKNRWGMWNWNWETRWLYNGDLTELRRIGYGCGLQELKGIGYKKSSVFSMKLFLNYNIVMERYDGLIERIKSNEIFERKA